MQRNPLFPANRPAGPVIETAVTIEVPFIAGNEKPANEPIEEVDRHDGHEDNQEPNDVVCHAG